eukprot:TRINITY_DN6532_c0_g1_i2.p1 TRINITY_DN6532_c0_g1~~TRINITY_DN6532_c0_g1_i2.p1  ORF type:complete len:336 (-),score=48.36 TRINITY_DN6532_c0_g1_i2:280-1287(-)
MYSDIPSIGSSSSITINSSGMTIRANGQTVTMDGNGMRISTDAGLPSVVMLPPRVSISPSPIPNLYMVPSPTGILPFYALHNPLLPPPMHASVVLRNLSSNESSSRGPASTRVVDVETMSAPRDLSDPVFEILRSLLLDDLGQARGGTLFDILDLTFGGGSSPQQRQAMSQREINAIPVIRFKEKSKKPRAQRGACVESAVDDLKKSNRKPEKSKKESNGAVPAGIKRKDIKKEKSGNNTNNETSQRLTRSKTKALKEDPKNMVLVDDAPQNVQGVEDDSEPSSDATCAICINDYKNGEELRMLSCEHKFHKNCIDKWLLRKNECPICRITMQKK